MKAALIETIGPFGKDIEIYTTDGDQASLILYQFERMQQDLSCLLNAAKANGKDTTALEDILDKYNYGELEMEDLLKLNLKLDVGSIKCLAIAETEDEVEALKKKYPNAAVR